MEYATTTALRPAAVSFMPTPALWLRLSVIYLIVGVGLGIADGRDRELHVAPGARAPQTCSGGRRWLWPD